MRAWSRQDTRYLIGLVLAVAVVSALVAADFGLVRPRVVGVDARGGASPVDVPSVEEQEEATPAPESTPGGPSPGPTVRPPPPGGARVPTDVATNRGAAPSPTPAPTPSPTPRCLLLVAGVCVE